MGSIISKQCASLWPGLVGVRVDRVRSDQHGHESQVAKLASQFPLHQEMDRNSPELYALRVGFPLTYDTM